MKYLLLLLFSLFIHPATNHACSMYKICGDGKTIVGNNEDWISLNTKAWFEPGKAGAYGTMFVGFLNDFAQGGMNEAGLMFDGFAIPHLAVRNTKGKTSMPIREAVNHVMHTYSNVSGAAIFQYGSELSPQDANLHNSLREALYRSGNKEAAKKSYKESLQIDPDNHRTRSMLERIEKVQKTHHDKIDNCIQQSQERYNVPGIALAIIKDGKLIHKKNYGLANIEHSVAVTNETLFPIFSTTKLFSAVAILQLLQEDKIALEDEITDFLNDLPASWQSVKVKHLLSHSSGLPDISAYNQGSEEAAISRIYQDPIRFKAGQRFDYNQSNFWLLSRICESIIGLRLPRYVLQNQFLKTQNDVYFQGNHLSVVPHQATVYDDHIGRGYLMESAYRVPAFNYASSGMVLNLAAFVEWEKRYRRGDFLTDQSKRLFTTPFDYEESRSFSYGLQIYEHNGMISYGFTGSAATAYRRFPEQDLSIILLANGMFIPAQDRGGIDELIDQLATLILHK